MLTIGRFADATGLTAKALRQAIRIEFVKYHELARIVWPLAADDGEAAG